ncbi:MAG: hypothetical protein K2X98_05465 [Alphaproteobacteria bacterium]|nr:hypothetical protein [Alphaproteobacteria bacterium]
MNMKIINPQIIVDNKEINYIQGSIKYTKVRPHEKIRHQTSGGTLQLIVVEDVTKRKPAKITFKVKTPSSEEQFLKHLKENEGHVITIIPSSSQAPITMTYAKFTYKENNEYITAMFESFTCKDNS